MQNAKAADEAALAGSSLNLIDDWHSLAREAKYSVKQLALLCKVSERHLRRFITSRHGVPPKDWLEQLRLPKAASLLAEGEQIKAIVSTFGFAHASHFSIAFKRHYGLTPREYRLKSSIETRSNGRKN
jgi:AraC-like DNA-binding protein